MKFKPEIPGSMGGKPHRRPHEDNQQVAQAIRPQLPRDKSVGGQNNVQGKMPAGFIAVWDFGNGTQTKDSPSRAKERKVY